jgi:hypothetical protein
MSPSSPPTPSMRPVGVPSGSGNGKYIVLVVVLLVAVIAIVLLKNCKSQPTQPQTNVTSMYDAAPISHDESTLPPPPPEDEPQVDSGPSGNRVIVIDACAVKTCSGKSSDELEMMLASRARAAHRCYDQALAQDSTLKGHVTIGVRVAQNGRLCSANIVENDMGAASVAACVQNVFARTGSLPVPKGGCLDAKIPINFVPGGH